MNGIGTIAYVRISWCPRCGTLKRDTVVNGGIEEVDAPKLVERCRKFDPTQGAAEGLYQWKKLGIAESINLPDTRPGRPLIEVLLPHESEDGL